MKLTNLTSKAECKVGLSSRPHSLSPSLPHALVLALLLSSAWSRAAEVYPTLSLGGQTYTNVHVIQETPVELLFRADGPWWKRVKRQDLPDALRDRYPYDAEKAVEYERKQTEEVRRQREQQRQQIYQTLLRREKEIERQIEVKTRELTELQKEIRNWRSKPRGTPGRGKMLDQLIDQRIALEKYLDHLRKQLEGVQEQQKQWR